MMFDEAPEEREQSFSCPKCHKGSVTQCVVSGDWTCDKCDFWAEPDDDNDDD
jgi:ribosomal protein L37AE/L43A